MDPALNAMKNALTLIIICLILLSTISIANLLEEKSVKVTRLARGLPIGGDLEFVDEATIMRAIEDRSEIQ